LYQQFCRARALANVGFTSSTALEGVEVVFHMAAPNSSINNYQLHYSVNVQGEPHSSAYLLLQSLNLTELFPM